MIVNKKRRLQRKERIKSTSMREFRFLQRQNCFSALNEWRKKRVDMCLVLNASISQEAPLVEFDAFVFMPYFVQDAHLEVAVNPLQRSSRVALKKASQTLLFHLLSARREQ